LGELGADAFETKANPSTNEEYQICETDTAIVWSYTIDVQHENDKLRPTISIGAFSKNANIMGISTTTFSNVPATATNAAISAIAARVVGAFVKQIVAGYAYPTAIAAAEEAATVGMEAVGMAIGDIVVIVAGVVSSLIIFVVVGIVFYLIFSFIHKSFGLEVNIYNWSKKEEWDIVEWHSDNALINNADSESQPFKEAKLEAVSRTFASSFVIFTDKSDFLFVQTIFQHRAAFLFPPRRMLPHMLPTPSKMESVKIMKFKFTSSN
jgi:hypothetical protein